MQEFQVQRSVISQELMGNVFKIQKLFKGFSKHNLHISMFHSYEQYATKCSHQGILKMCVLFSQNCLIDPPL